MRVTSHKPSAFRAATAPTIEKCRDQLSEQVRRSNEITADGRGRDRRRGARRRRRLRIEQRQQQRVEQRQGDADLLRRRLRHRAGQQHDQVLGRHRDRLPQGATRASRSTCRRSTGPTSRPRCRRWSRTSSIPDILEGNPAPQFAQSPACSTRRPECCRRAWCSNLIPKFLKDGQYQGTDYGIPFTTSTRALYYNKKIFAAAGISAPPTDLGRSCRADAAKIKAKGDIGYGMPLGSEEAQAESLLWFLGNGGGYLNSGGQVRHQQPAERRHAELHEASLATAGDTQPSPGSTDRKDVWADFAAGQDRHGARLPGRDPDHPGRRACSSPSDYATAAVPGKTGPLTVHAGRARRHRRLQGSRHGHQAAIKKFLDFAYQDK